jgi:hypothetical protein
MLLLSTWSISASDNVKLPLIDPDAAPWNKFPKKQVKPAPRSSIDGRQNSGQVLMQARSQHKKIGININ